MEEKAQVSLEYLLVVVGAIMVVTTVAVYIKSTAQSATQAIQETATE
ncbi:MAG: hypothetical protein PHP82_02935 [Candidatus ainarchaeum sp.]|nr:hypothetical protein [Candidatus ainarchaeum sp.]